MHASHFNFSFKNHRHENNKKTSIIYTLMRSCDCVLFIPAAAFPVPTTFPRLSILGVELRDSAIAGSYLAPC